ncbi:MAG TPA: oligosaccharide flippase family protein [Acidobacteriaceae bacterium]|nr:oligosaccharide flippase family protein [Acidobacteriaceae bacterium]
MSPLLSEKAGSAKRLLQTLKQSMSVDALKSLLTKRQGNAGRERYRRAGLTASASFISKALTIVISFVSVPLTVNYLGPERYGVWLTIGSLLTWMSMTDFGIAGNALVNLLADAHGKEDKRLAGHHAASAFWTLVGLSLCIGTIFLFTFHMIPWQAVFHVSSAVPAAELERACAYSLIFFVVGFPLSMVNSVYGAYQDGFMSNIWNIVGSSLALISLIVVAQMKGGLPQLVLAISGTRALVGFANVYFMFFRKYPWLIPWPSKVRWTSIKRLLSLGGNYMVTQLAGLGIYQSQPMIITQMLGPSYVVIFVVTQKIVTLPNDLVFMATAPFISAYGEAKARADWGWIHRAFRNSVRASLAFGVPVTVAIALVAKPLIRIWAGRAAIPNTQVVLWLSVYTLICVGMLSVGQLLCGLERADVLAYSLSLCALCTIGLGIVFARWWGIGGVAFAMALSKFCTSSPIQLFKIRGILRANRAPALVVEEPSLA